MSPNERHKRAELRSEGRDRRRRIRGTERSDRERQLCLHLQSVDVFLRGNCVSVGVFIADDGEPDLAHFVAPMRDRGIGVSLPALSEDPADSSMRFVTWHVDDALGAGRFGIPTPPPHADEVVPDVLLVPFVRFDPAGNRLGRGGGFFDRYLSAYSGHTIGVGFELQRAESLEAQPHDVPLATVVTDAGVRFL